MSETRPTSPFLILVLGAAATALGAEWLRFGWGPWLAAGPAAAGAVATILGVGRAFRRRRAWRARRDAERTDSLHAEGATAAQAAPTTVPRTRETHDDDGIRAVRRPAPGRAPAGNSAEGAGDAGRHAPADRERVPAGPAPTERESAVR